MWSAAGLMTPDCRAIVALGCGATLGPDMSSDAAGVAAARGIGTLSAITGRRVLKPFPRTTIVSLTGLVPSAEIITEKVFSSAGARFRSAIG